MKIWWQIWILGIWEFIFLSLSIWFIMLTLKCHRWYLFRLVIIWLLLWWSFLVHSSKIFLSKVLLKKTLKKSHRSNAFVYLIHSSNRYMALDDIYFWFYLSFLLVRVYSTLFSCASIHESATTPLDHLGNIPSHLWTLDVSLINSLLSFSNFYFPIIVNQTPWHNSVRNKNSRFLWQTIFLHLENNDAEFFRYHCDFWIGIVGSN